MTWHRLRLGEDAAGVRYRLDGRPLHCGDVLALRLPSGEVEVTFQVEPVRGEPPRPVLTLATFTGATLRLRPDAGGAWTAFDLRWPAEEVEPEDPPW